MPKLSPERGVLLTLCPLIARATADSIWGYYPLRLPIHFGPQAGCPKLNCSREGPRLCVVAGTQTFLWDTDSCTEGVYL
jgi:hypothetical protein